jgi:hypothetical protein
VKRIGGGRIVFGRMSHWRDLALRPLLKTHVAP